MNTTELPMYQSHKKVWALKIKVIYPKIDTAEIFPEDGTYGRITVSDDYIVKHNPEIGGYYVRYEDGYESYSPAKAFEAGYTLMTNKEVDYDKFQKLVEECAPEPRPEEELLRPKVEKSLGNTSSNTAAKNIKDIVVWGDGDMFKLLSKASSKNEGWMKSTKAMEITNVGCVVQVTTQQNDHVAEAVTFVPNARIVEEITTSGNYIEVTGRRLVHEPFKRNN